MSAATRSPHPAASRRPPPCEKRPYASSAPQGLTPLCSLSCSHRCPPASGSRLRHGSTPSGTAAQSVTFTPSDPANYNSSNSTVSVTVNKADPSITSWPTASPITLKVVRDATSTVIPRLDQNFFRVRFDRLTPSEKKFLRAMADLGPGAHRTGDIAEKLGVKITSLGPGRANLIRKGMIFSPAHGDMAFTVPLFDEFMVRAIREFNP